MSDDDRLEEINETDLEGSAPVDRQRSARNNPAMRDGDNSHGNPMPESERDDPLNDSDSDVGDTTPSLESEEYGILDAVPSNDPGTGQEAELEEPQGSPYESRPAGRPVDRPAVPESRRSRPDTPSSRDPESGTERLPLENYPSLTIPQIFEKIPTLSNEEVRAIRDYEKSHRRRKTLLVKLERHLRPTEGQNRGSDRSHHT